MGKIQVSTGTGKILGGLAEALSYAFKGKEARKRVSQLGGLIAEALEDGVSIEVDAKDNRIGVGLRRGNEKQPPPAKRVRNGR